MTNKETAEIIKTAIAEVEWEYPMEYAAAFDRAIEVLEQEPKTGHWIFDEMLDRSYYCSECKSMGVDYWDYCPYCGCRMVEPQESEDNE